MQLTRFQIAWLVGVLLALPWSLYVYSLGFPNGAVGLRSTWLANSMVFGFYHHAVLPHLYATLWTTPRIEMWRNATIPNRLALVLCIATVVIAVGYSCLFGNTLSADGVVNATLAAEKLEELRPKSDEIRDLRRKIDLLIPVDANQAAFRKMLVDDREKKINETVTLRVEYHRVVDTATLSEAFSKRNFAGYWGIMSSLIFAGALGFEVWLILNVLVSSPASLLNDQSQFGLTRKERLVRLRRNVLLSFVLAVIWIPSRFYNDCFVKWPLLESVPTPEFVFATVCATLALMAMLFSDATELFSVDTVLKAVGGTGVFITLVLVQFPNGIVPAINAAKGVPLLFGLCIVLFTSLLIGYLHNRLNN